MKDNTLDPRQLEPLVTEPRMAEDAIEPNVTEPTPSNQISSPLSKAVELLEEFWRKHEIDPLDSDGPSE